MSLPDTCKPRAGQLVNGIEKGEEKMVDGQVGDGKVAL